MSIDDFLTILSIFLGAGWAVCEILARIPSIKANSTFQFIYELLGKIKSKK